MTTTSIFTTAHVQMVGGERPAKKVRNFLLPSARLRQGSVFTRVCHSVQGGVSGG